MSKMLYSVWCSKCEHSPFIDSPDLDSMTCRICILRTLKRDGVSVNKPAKYMKKELNEDAE